MSDNYYDFLGLSPDASAGDIKKAFRTLALRYHTDTGLEKSDDKMKKLLLIYSVLSDPAQRILYDESIARNSYKHSSSKGSKARQSENRAAPEDFSVATFVDGLEVRDAASVREYVRLGDYLYYKVKVDKKILFWTYPGTDMYRTKVIKIYSKKRNNFRNVPLFVVRYQDVNHIIFETDFTINWYTENGFKVIERRSAIKSLTIGICTIAAVIYVLMKVP